MIDVLGPVSTGAMGGSRGRAILSLIATMWFVYSAGIVLIWLLVYVVGLIVGGCWVILGCRARVLCCCFVV